MQDPEELPRPFRYRGRYAQAGEMETVSARVVFLPLLCEVPEFVSGSRCAANVLLGFMRHTDRLCLCQESSWMLSLDSHNGTQYSFDIQCLGESLQVDVVPNVS